MAACAREYLKGFLKIFGPAAKNRLPRIRPPDICEFLKSCAIFRSRLPKSLRGRAAQYSRRLRPLFAVGAIFRTWPHLGRTSSSFRLFGADAESFWFGNFRRNLSEGRRRGSGGGGLLLLEIRSVPKSSVLERRRGRLTVMARRRGGRENSAEARFGKGEIRALRALFLLFLPNRPSSPPRIRAALRICAVIRALCVGGSFEPQAPPFRLTMLTDSSASLSSADSEIFLKKDVAMRRTSGRVVIFTRNG